MQVHDGYHVAAARPRSGFEERPLLLVVGITVTLVTALMALNYIRFFHH